jgi:MFS family permease
MMSRFLPGFTRDQWLICLSFFLWGFSIGLWLHLQPIYIRFLGAEPQEVGATIGLAGLGVVFLYIPMGLLADRRRRKPIMVGGWLAGTAATFLIGLAPDWRWAIPGLTLYLFSSFSRPAVAGYIVTSHNGGNISRIFAYLSAGFSLGTILSPALGGWIAEQWGLRSVFMAATGVAVLSTLAMACVSNRPAPDPARVHEVRLQRLLSDRLFLWQTFIFALIVFALEVGVILAPNYLQDEKGLNLQQIGQLGTVASLGMFVFMLGLGSMRSDRRTSLLLNQLVVMVGLILLLNAPTGAGLAIFSPALVLGYFMRGATWAIWPITRGRAAHWLAPEVISLGFGFLDTASQLAQTTAPFIAGLLYAYEPSWPLYAGLMALSVTMLLTLRLPQRSASPVVELPVASSN